MSTSLNAYLNFDGNTADAMTFYAQVLGGELQIMRFGDSPMPVTPETKDRVMHATLRTPAITLMASDTMPGMPFSTNGNISLSLNFDDAASQDAAWAKLAEGGAVTMPLSQQFFGRFGMIRDRFGVHWMLHYNAQAAH